MIPASSARGANSIKRNCAPKCEVRYCTKHDVGQPSLDLLLIWSRDLITVSNFGGLDDTNWSRPRPVARWLHLPIHGQS
jgi:hypothetical protein